MNYKEDFYTVKFIFQGITEWQTQIYSITNTTSAAQWMQPDLLCISVVCLDLLMLE